VSEAADQARRDVLTGLSNRLAWEEALVRQRASSRPIGVLIADLDGLKPANDTFGHEVGDQLLATFAGMVRRATPDGRDIVVARLGGDEFGVLLPGDDGAAAAALDRALRAALLAAPPVAGLVVLSASLGTGLAASGAGLDAAIEEADKGVYVDKGRIGVVRRPSGA
jgi:diguanylate cyclase (GGDEF)-like protein